MSKKLLFVSATTDVEMDVPDWLPVTPKLSPKVVEELVKNQPPQPSRLSYGESLAERSRQAIEHSRQAIERSQLAIETANALSKATRLNLERMNGALRR